MRKTKFRVWDKQIRKFQNDEFHIRRFCLSPDGKVFWYCHTGLEDITEKVEVTLSTGLTDKNGKEIYEGDIVEGTKPCRGSYRKGVVVYRPMCFTIECGRERIKRLNGMTIIGNIYQNPELLERKDHDL